MAVDVRIEVEDVTQRLADGYTRIELETASSPGGTFSLLIAIDLVDSTYYYSYHHAGGTVNTWYRYRFTAAGGGAPFTEYSNPFQPEGATRLKIRQRALLEYNCGLVLTAAAGGDTNNFICNDYRIDSSVFRISRGKGSWLYPATGVLAGQTRIASNSSPAAGSFDVEPDWSVGPTAGDQFEWHWLIDPDTWNTCINRALQRYKYVERVPLTGQNTAEISLAFLPWLKTKRDFLGIWHYPDPSSIEQAWGTTGRWWDIRQDRDSLVLMTTPVIDSTTTVYLEAYRAMPALHTDSAVAPCDIDVAAALAYDEVLAYLLRPGQGSQIDRSAWLEARALHQATLKRFRLRMPMARRQAPQLPYPAIVPVPWKAR